MKLLTNSNNVILEIAEEITPETDRWFIPSKNLAILFEYKSQDMEGNITTDTISLHEVDEIPEKVEPSKYCYTDEDGFFKNPDWKPFYSVEERLDMLEALELERMMSEE